MGVWHFTHDVHFLLLMLGVITPRVEVFNETSFFTFPNINQLEANPY